MSSTIVLLFVYGYIGDAWGSGEAIWASGKIKHNSICD